MNEIDIAGARAAFQREGFLALPGYFSANEIDRVDASAQEVMRTRGTEIVIDDLQNGERTFYAFAADEGRERFKMNDLYLVVPEVRELALQENLARLLRELLAGEAPVLCNSLTLKYGTSQPMHIDSLFMTPLTPRHLIATWIAFEDVHPAAGPLGYFPGSQDIPLHRFRDGTHHASNEEMPAWHEYIEAEVQERKLEKKTFLARKGDVFVWHSDLLHGGEPVLDPVRTRRSLVCHYFTESDARKLSPSDQLEPLHAGYWWRREPQGVHAAPERFDANHPFPEENYLRRYSDLRDALARGIISSGFDHYQRHGYGEGRLA